MRDAREQMDVVAGIDAPSVEMHVVGARGGGWRVTCGACGDTALSIGPRAKAVTAARIHASTTHGVHARVMPSRPRSLP